MPLQIADGYYIHWGVVQISLANLLVIVAMIVLFLAAIAFQLPHSSEQARPGASEKTPDHDQD